jgi:hypothetical protein
MEEAPEGKTVPISGEKLKLACKAMQEDLFFERLTCAVVGAARSLGLSYPVTGNGKNMQLPGAVDCSDIAATIVQKALSGEIQWDVEKYPDFWKFCASRSGSVLSSTWKKNKRSSAYSPIEEMGADGKETPTMISRLVDPTDFYENLAAKENQELGNEFLEDLALSLDDGSSEQEIIMAIVDDRTTATRKELIKKLEIDGQEYDRAWKRIQRALPNFKVSWLADKQLTPEEEKSMT